jgi:peptidoglycan hydrolase CwlO-like protein
VIIVDDDIVLGLLEEMDSEINELKSDNKSMRKEIDDLKSNPVQSVESQAVECTCDEQEKWRRITLMFIEDQETALNDHKDAVKSDINRIEAQVSKLEGSITDMRKQID